MKQVFGVPEKNAIITTFLMGMFAGGYLYLLGFAPQLEKFRQQFTPKLDTRLEIVADEYGGCELNQQCQSFQILSDGSYSYLAHPQAAVMKGRLASAEWRHLKKVLTIDNLVEANLPVNKETCSSYLDGADYRYRIKLGEDSFRLDSCATNLVAVPELNQALQKIWPQTR